MDIRFTNSTSFDYYARWSYERFIYYQPHIKTEGLYQDNLQFYIVCPDLDSQLFASDGTLIQDWFKQNKTVTSPVGLVKEKPPNAKRISERTIKEIVDFSGCPRTLRGIIVDLIFFLPKEFPIFYFEETEFGKAIIYVERDLNNTEIDLLKEAIRKIEIPWEFRIVSGYDAVNKSFPFRSKYHDGDIDLIPSRLLTTSLSISLKNIIEEDEDFWRTNRHNIFSGQIKDVNEILPKEWSNLKTACVINAAAHPQADIRNYLSIYNNLIISPPLKGREDDVLASMGIKLGELIELVRTGRIYFIIPQSIDRYSLNMLEPLIEISPEKFIFSRKLASLTVLDTRKRFPFLYPSFGVAERTAILSNLLMILNNMSDDPVGKIIYAIVEELERIWLDAEWRIHTEGAMATSILGIAPILSSIVKSAFGIARELEFYSAASSVEWAAPLNASVSSIVSVNGYSDENYMQLLANTYSGIKVGQFPVFIRQTSEVLKGLLSINSDIPVIAFAESFQSSDIKKLHELIHQISIGHYQSSTNDIQKIIDNFNRDIRAYESKLDKLAEWNIAGFIQGASRLAGAAATGATVASKYPELAIGLASVPLSVWLIEVLKAKCSNNALVLSSLDKFKAFSMGTTSEVVLVSRLRKKLRE